MAQVKTPNGLVVGLVVDEKEEAEKKAKEQAEQAETPKRNRK